MPPSSNNSGPVSDRLEAGQTVGGGRFLLKRLLGQGGMGVVWQAHDRLLREPVALKFLPPQVCFDPEAIAGLRRETLRARRLSHPNILRVHDLVDQPGEPSFICMEFVEGSNLHIVRSHHPSKVLRWDYLAPLLRQVAAALDYAHGEGIIHRDIKPANLILGGGDRVKLADFGLARVISDSLSRLSGPSGVADGSRNSGTVEYMSPQQADGGLPQASDDIYAVGATFYELLTSTPPFYRGDVSFQIRNALPEDPNMRVAGVGLNNEIPPAVSALLMACLAKKPEQRPPTARAILDWLDTSPDGLPAQAEPKSTAEEPSPPSPASHPPDADRHTATPGSLEPRLVAPADDRASHRRWIAAAAIGVLVLASAWFARKGWLLPAGAESERENGVRPSETSNGVAPPRVTRAGDRIESPGDGFIALFNGSDLTGWSGEPGVWYVKEGAITAWAAEEGIVRRQNTCLVWDGEVDDFELRLKFRQVDVIAAKPANSGVLYRARLIEDWQVRGFQADLNGDFTGSLLILREDGLDPRAELGRSVRIIENGGRTTIKNTGVVADSNQILQSLRKGDWNELTIIARGNGLVHKVNGTPALEALDESQPVPTLSGRLALEMKRATLVQFKDIWLKKL